MDIPFIDLQAQRQRLEPGLSAAIQRVMERGDFIQGQEVREFESALAAFTATDHVVSCANGTDALTLVAMAENTGPGDAIFVPAFTFAATAEAFLILGAIPYFVDVEVNSFNMSAESLEVGIIDAIEKGLKPRMVVAVDLFGQPADYKRISLVAQKFDLILVADAAQSLGATLDGKRVGTIADYTTTSFFPAKPLGCYGDGGVVLTGNGEKAALVRSLAQHGKGVEKYDNIRVGMNSRLDTLQAAILLEKLKIFEDELQARDKIAQRYSNALGNIARVPIVAYGATSAWAQYTLRFEEREIIQQKLKAAGIPTAVYYPLPLNQQEGYKNCPVAPDGVPNSVLLAQQVLSLPMHAYLTEEVQSKIIKEIECL